VVHPVLQVVIFGETKQVAVLHRPQIIVLCSTNTLTFDEGELVSVMKCERIEECTEKDIHYS